MHSAGPDSFFRWGFFHEVLQGTEYIEAYIMEPAARRMLDADPACGTNSRGDWRRTPDSPATPTRLRFFHERSPYSDDRYRLYPVAREVAR